MYELWKFKMWITMRSDDWITLLYYEEFVWKTAQK